jgi:hypothetical protein
MPLHLVPGRPTAGTYRVVLRGDGKLQPVITPLAWRVVERLWGRESLGVTWPSWENSTPPVGCPMPGDRFDLDQGRSFHYPPDSLSSYVWSKGVRRSRLQEERRISTQIPLWAGAATAACLRVSMMFDAKSGSPHGCPQVFPRPSTGSEMVARQTSGSMMSPEPTR